MISPSSFFSDGFGRPKLEVGDRVRATEGPFKSLEGTITFVDPEAERVTMEVIVFGRRTPVEVESWQVEKT
ncbi:MAG: KOW motif-containing protein [Planctomycetaceae bacterium]